MKIWSFIRDLVSDGYAPISVIVALFLGAFGLAKAMGWIPQITGVPVAWALAPACIVLLIAYTRRRAAHLLASDDSPVGKARRIQAYYVSGDKILQRLDDPRRGRMADTEDASVWLRGLQSAVEGTLGSYAWSKVSNAPVDHTVAPGRIGQTADCLVLLKAYLPVLEQAIDRAND